MKDYPLDRQHRERIAAHVRRYQETNGREGHVLVDENGRERRALLLTTTGRRSGEPRTTPANYGRDGDRFVIVASLAGYDHPPQWYLNLSANPRVALQVGSERFEAIARTATQDERPRLWAMMVEIFPPYAEYQAATEREIPVVILEPVP